MYETNKPYPSLWVHLEEEFYGMGELLNIFCSLVFLENMKGKAFQNRIYVLRACLIMINIFLLRTLRIFTKKWNYKKGSCFLVQITLFLHLHKRKQQLMYHQDPVSKVRWSFQYSEIIYEEVSFMLLIFLGKFACHNKILTWQLT